MRGRIGTTIIEGGTTSMPRYPYPDSLILSLHRFKRPAIRIWLPLVLFLTVLFCGWLAAPRIRLFEFVGLVFLIYVAVSALVSISEIAVTPEGLIIDRLLLPERFVPWSAIDRVIIFGAGSEGEGAELEITSIGLYDGLSPLNRLPGPVYGQGFRQTLIIAPDTIEAYDALIASLRENCNVFEHRQL